MYSEYTEWYKEVIAICFYFVANKESCLQIFQQMYCIQL